jgi:hypothetical protein
MRGRRMSGAERGGAAGGGAPRSAGYFTAPAVSPET